MGYYVCKFGGSSVSNIEKIDRIYDILNTNSERKYVVVSAPGKDKNIDEKITDILIDLSKNPSNNKTNNYLEKINKRFGNIIKDSALNNKNEFLQSVMNELTQRIEIKDKDPNKYEDKIKSFGEETNAKIIAEHLKSRGMNAKYIDPLDTGLYVSDEFGNAQILDESYLNLNEYLKKQDGIIIFPGFYGYTKKGDIATFSRGGSDLSGAILAASVDACIYENWTDVDGIYRADPNIVYNPEIIKYLTYDEIRELSYMGFNVFHDEAIFPLINNHIPTHLKNSKNLSSQGTLISKYRIPQEDEIITGIACKKGFCTLNMTKYLRKNDPEFMVKVINTFQEEGIPIEHMPSGIDSISAIFEKKYLNNNNLDRITRKLEQKHKVDNISIKGVNDALVTTVGQGMNHKKGVATRVTKALADNDINIEMINQGASEINITIGIKEENADNAVCAIYDEFIRKK